MEQHFKAAPLDLKAKGMTAFFFIIMVVVAVSIGEPTFAIPLALALSVGVSLFAVRGYSLTDDALIVHHLYGSRRFPLANLTNATLDPAAIVGSIRTFGIGGVWGYIGRFRNSTLGPYQAYLTNGAQSMLLTFGQKHVVISPAESVEFLSLLTPRLHV